MLFRSGEEQRDRYLTPNEIKKILEVPGPRIRTFFLFAINTGMRCDNIKSLQWKDVHWKSGTINVPKNKSGKAYSVPINRAVRSILEARAKLGTVAKVVIPARRKLGSRKQTNTFLFSDAIPYHSTMIISWYVPSIMIIIEYGTAKSLPE